MFRRWWNRWLVRLGRVDPDWRRGTFDPATGWHSSYRLLTWGGKTPQVTTGSKWIETHRWYDPTPSRILDSAIDYRTTGGRGSVAKWRRALTDEEIGKVTLEWRDTDG